MRRGIVIAALVACAPVGREPGDAATPNVQQKAASLPAELREVVQPWQRVAPEWLARASVWLVADYTQDSYPCVPGPDGSLDMIQRDAFAPTRVLRGEVAARSLDIDMYALQGPSYPDALAEGRSYLVLLAPTPALAARLADPRTIFAMHERIGPGQIVAVIDLSQSADDAAAETTAASRSELADGHRFDPQVWAEARAAAAITAAQHGPLARFLAAKLLQRPGATVVEARSWVGAPDVVLRSARGLTYRYWLARPRYATPQADAIYGQLELQFLDGTLRRGSLRYFQWHAVPGGTSSIALTPAQLQPLGLAEFRLGPA